jgi:phosphoenolpyruvate synthase/pyruvate phosphate dikinase
LGTIGELESNFEALHTASVKKEISELGRIEYWAEELTPPLFGITDIKQAFTRDNFLCIYENNTVIFYYINNRDENEAEIGYKYFSKEGSVEHYEQEVNKILHKLETLNEISLPFEEVTEVSREFNDVYIKTEEVRLKKFEEVEEEKNWSKFKKIAHLRLRMRKALESNLFPKSDLMLSEIASAHKINKDDLFFYTYDELEELRIQNKKVSSKIILDRKRGYVYWIKDGKTVLYTGDKFKAISKEIHTERVGMNVKEIKGRTASEGVVRLILNNSKNLNEQVQLFEEGMILVTEMTRPQTLMACYRAKAIVTDEGGVVSHAAIISRELKIPCVMGTKVATKILKNGDLVEVDANQGIVRILENRKE